MNIVDLGQFKPGRKRPNTGFYMVANCPKCTAPLFWHGPGEMNGQEADEMIYPSCLCDWEGDIELAAPDDYSFEIERHSLNILFRNLYRTLQEAGLDETVSNEEAAGSGEAVRQGDEGSEEGRPYQA